MLRLGRAMAMLRLGKRAMNMLRLGRSDGSLVDEADKRAMPMLRLGKRPFKMLRLGKRFDSAKYNIFHILILLSDKYLLNYFTL
jgi:hypothetical protein